MIIREATVDDADIIVELVNCHADKGLMLSKTPYKVFSTIQNFFVAEKDGKVIGCVSLSVIWRDLCEVCSLAVADDYKGQGIGKKLVEVCIERARKLKIPRVIALTYQNKFFEKLGFKFVDKDKFPRKLWRECLECPKLEQCDELAYVYYL
ncbi:MAG: N-acetyltransferase [Spirochaetes bacterium]|nr:N-acetyltransferase [Spirochaetota bacterium]